MIKVIFKRSKIKLYLEQAEEYFVQEKEEEEKKKVEEGRGRKKQKKKKKGQTVPQQNYSLSFVIFSLFTFPCFWFSIAREQITWRASQLTSCAPWLLLESSICFITIRFTRENKSLK
tara:strand:- start:2396 stop:2746 length:351 start_codon:yes stop_codon:yes gene_type:complete